MMVRLKNLIKKLANINARLLIPPEKPKLKSRPERRKIVFPSLENTGGLSENESSVSWMFFASGMLYTQTDEYPLGACLIICFSNDNFSLLGSLVFTDCLHRIHHGHKPIDFHVIRYRIPRSKSVALCHRAKLSTFPSHLFKNVIIIIQYQFIHVKSPMDNYQSPHGFG